MYQLLEGLRFGYIRRKHKLKRSITGGNCTSFFTMPVLVTEKSNINDSEEVLTTSSSKTVFQHSRSAGQSTKS